MNAELQHELYVAVRDGDVARVETLVAKIEGGVNARPFEALWHAPGAEATCLHLAACCARPHVAAWLVSHGANPLLRMRDGKTPLDCVGAFDLFAPALVGRPDDVAAVRSLLRAATPSPQGDPTALVGVIFDMDGTLTLPSDLDFGELRRRFGIPREADIMSHLATAMPRHETRLAAVQAVEDLEAKAREGMVLQPGAAELIERVTQRGLKTALLTRNSRLTVDMLLCKLGPGARFDAVVSRDDLPGVPSKPDPAPVHHICRLWSCDPSQVLVVGDFSHDLQCANSAGAASCLLLNPRNSCYAFMATHVIRSLLELLPIVGCQR
jgi:HAD superfamily hydrolase (TIGR01549 family)